MSSVGSRKSIVTKGIRIAFDRRFVFSFRPNVVRHEVAQQLWLGYWLVDFGLGFRLGRGRGIWSNASM